MLQTKKHTVSPLVTLTLHIASVSACEIVKVSDHGGFVVGYINVADLKLAVF